MSSKSSSTGRKVKARGKVDTDHIYDDLANKKTHWSLKEDGVLRNRVAMFAAKNWDKIAEGVPGRSGKSCRLRWLNVLSPDISRTPFTPEEDAIVLEKHAELGNQWSIISEFLPGRTDNAVKNRWNSFHKRAARDNAKAAIEKPNSSREKRPADDMTASLSEERKSKTIRTEERVDPGAEIHSGMTSTPAWINGEAFPVVPTHPALHRPTAMRIAQPQEVRPLVTPSHDARPHLETGSAALTVSADQPLEEIVPSNGLPADRDLGREERVGEERGDPKNSSADSVNATSKGVFSIMPCGFFESGVKVEEGDGGKPEVVYATEGVVYGSTLAGPSDIGGFCFRSPTLRTLQ